MDKITEIPRKELQIPETALRRYDLPVANLTNCLIKRYLP